MLGGKKERPHELKAVLRTLLVNVAYESGVDFYN